MPSPDRAGVYAMVIVWPGASSLLVSALFLLFGDPVVGLVLLGIGTVLTGVAYYRLRRS